MINLVHDTRNALLSGNRELSQDIARIYRTLGQHSAQLQALYHATRMVQQSVAKIALRPSMTIFSNHRVHDENAEVTTNQEADDCTIDIFFDCVSRISEENSQTILKSLCAKFSGCLSSYFERGSSYFPEIYTSNSAPGENLFLAATAVPGQYMTRFYLHYMVNPRRWHRINMCMITTDIAGDTMNSVVVEGDSLDQKIQVLPRAFRCLIDALLPDVELFDPVTSLQVSLVTTSSGELNYNPLTVRSTEDYYEMTLLGEEQILEDIQSMGCKQHQESDVITISRITSSRFRVQVGSMLCTEQKAPFAHAGQQIENGFHNFVEDLKLLWTLRDVAGVVRFEGVVLDDEKRHLKGYLHEEDFVGLDRLLEKARSNKDLIPWPQREAWGKRIIEIVHEIHSKNLFIGNFRLENINIRADGTLALSHLQHSIRRIWPFLGFMPPELREISVTDSQTASSSSCLSQRTDIFQLGFVLWSLAEHITYPGAHLCVASGCSQFPRYSCFSAHKNLIQLPFLAPTTPEYFKGIIRQCRSELPELRPSATDIYHRITPVEGSDGIDPALQKYWNACAEEKGTQCRCNECGELCAEDFYHCGLCEFNQFDICAACFALGISCPERHGLAKRCFTSAGELIEIA